MRQCWGGFRPYIRALTHTGVEGVGEDTDEPRTALVFSRSCQGPANIQELERS